MTHARFWVCLILLLISCLVLLPGTAQAQPSPRCSNPIATLEFVTGSVKLTPANSDVPIPAQKGALICPGDFIDVKAYSRAKIAYLDGQTSTDAPGPVTFRIRKTDQGNTLIDLILGKIRVSWKRLKRAVLGKPRLEFRTPCVNGTVTGTEFMVQAEQDRTVVAVLEGRVRLENEYGNLTLTGSQSAVTVAGQAPQLRIPVRPRDAVQWTLYYQPVFSTKWNPSLPETPQNRAIRESLEYLRLGETDKAFDRMDQVPENERSERFYVYRASLLLGLGSSEEADADIKKALSLSPESGEAYALQAVMAIARNDVGQAISDGRKAVQLSPRSSAAKIALSYGLQAGMKLEEARDILLQAVQDDPEDPLAWARLSETWLSLGYLDQAEEAARKAISVGPDLAQAHAALGFAWLAQMKITQAKSSFEKAVSLEPENPLTRLGMGLAMIRKGDLNEGRQEIETAAQLDPNNALIRSYLGKAYFEERRDARSAEEFDLAKKLDPQDPTAYFYDAIRKQTINRPVEALRDLQKSIELNDNRAVYRSRLLLDQDLAARSASLGRIYRDLGFEQLALVEGWNSLRSDPGNYSAHRFLADTYSSLPRHEIARVSELLQSQLRQPINLTPLQPQLTENNLQLLSGAGPSEAAFNEFNPLFTRNRMALQADGFLGNESTTGDDLVVAGIYGKLSLSAGQYHYDTDGFRENNDRDQNIYNAFVQYSLTPGTSIQGEFRSMDKRYGDTGLTLDPDNYSTNLRNKVSQDTFRLGFHHAFSPKSGVIASFMTQSADATAKISYDPYGNVTLNKYIDGYIFEVQHLYRSEHYNILSGVGHFDADAKWINDIFGSQTVLRPDVRQTNGYVYSQFSYIKNVTLTVGLSVDSFKDTNRDFTQANPKIGLTWQALPDTVIRLSGFRALKRNLVANQTIEPTQVAGFNQFYDDEDGTDTRHFGFALDHKFTQDLYAGAEVSKRILTFARFDLSSDPAPAMAYKWEERLGRSYLYWMPLSFLATSAEYQYERFKMPAPADTINLNSTLQLESHRVPLQLNFYHPIGIFASFGATYFDQWGTFVDSLANSQTGEDCFWVLDAAIGYRFPKRYGLWSLGIKNLTDRNFKFQDTDALNPTHVPERVIFTRLTLSF